MSQLPPFTIKDLMPQDVETKHEDFSNILEHSSSDCDGMAPVFGSSTIDRVGWKDGTLKVKFKGVRPQTWEYTPVNDELFHSLMASPSKGKFFARYIKGNKHIKGTKIV